MECKNDAALHGEDCEKPRNKEEHLSSEEITTESQTSYVQQNYTDFVKCNVQSMDTKVGILQETLNPTLAYSDIKSNPNQPSTFLGTGSIKDDNAIHIKEEYIIPVEVSTKLQAFHLQQSEAHFMEYNMSVDVDTKIRIKHESWDQNEGLSDIKSDPEQPSTIDPVPFMGPDIIKSENEIDIKEELWCYEETSTGSLNEGEGNGSKRNEGAEHVPLVESSRQCTDAVSSSSATQLQANKNISSMSAKPSISAQNCEKKNSFKIFGKRFELFSFVEKRNLHALKDHPIHSCRTQYRCGVCGKSFWKLKYLKAHLLLHDDKQQYKCQICGKNLKQLRYLKSHLLLHSDKRQYKCEICAKSFKQLHGLKSHLLVHDDKMPYACQTCEKVFRHLGSLKKHLLVHNDKNNIQVKIGKKASNS